MNPRIIERANAEAEFTRCLTILDFEPTREILEELRSAILAGVKPVHIKEALKMLSQVQRNR